jgi:hypothetical protein
MFDCAGALANSSSGLLWPPGLKPIPGGDIVNGRKSAQIEVLRAPPEPQSGGIFAFLTDPDGNRISLRQAGS